MKKNEIVYNQKLMSKKYNWKNTQKYWVNFELKS